MLRRHNGFPVRYELGFYIPEDGILHSHRRGNLKSYTFSEVLNWCSRLGLPTFLLPL
jgi:hypothetical protein